MVTREDVESYLMRMQLESDEVEPGMWVVPSGEEGANLVIHFTPPLLLLRAKVLDLPADREQCSDLYRRLLELNANDLVHGAYGVEENDVILGDALELENLDFNEFQAAVDSVQLALAAHREVLTPFRTC